MNSEELRISFDVDEESLAKSRESREELEKRVAELDLRLRREEEKHSWNRLAESIHPTNVEKGFWDEPVMMDKYAAKMMLVVTETAEVIEALRKSQGTAKVTEEFADIFIRALDLYGRLVQDGEADPELYGVLLDKLETNKNRAPKHGNRWG